MPPRSPRRSAAQSKADKLTGTIEPTTASAELATLTALAQALSGPADLATSLEAALATVADLLGLETGWVWLLDEYGRRTGHDLTCRADGLFEVALEQGLAPDGSIVDALAPDGIMLKPSRRLWPHTEAIKAAAARHRRGDLAAQRFAEAMARRLMHLFVGRPIAGGWIDHISADGAPLVDHMPASSLYHLLLAGQVAAKGFASAPALAKAAP